MLAFYIGRFFLSETVKKQFAGNEIFNLIENSIADKPVQSALFMRYSSFPQLVKNFGLAVVPLKPSIFALAIFVHGVPYSLLWSYVGNETKRRLNAPVDGALQTQSKFYEGILLFSTIFGLVGSPAIVAYWIRDMKKDFDKKKKR